MKYSQVSIDSIVMETVLHTKNPFFFIKYKLSEFNVYDAYAQYINLLICKHCKYV